MDKVKFPETLRKFRGHNFYPPKADLKKIPNLYSTEDTPLDDKIIYIHYFGSSQDWYIAELDQGTGLAFGYADLGFGMGEWGEIYLPEIEAVKGQFIPIERDLSFTPQKASEVIK